MLPLSFNASAVSAETSTSKDARVVGMPCICVSSFFDIFFFLICAWTLRRFKKKKNLLLVQVPSKSNTNNSKSAQKTPGAVAEALVAGGCWWFPQRLVIPVIPIRTFQLVTIFPFCFHFKEAFEQIPRGLPCLVKVWDCL